MQRQGRKTGRYSWAAYANSTNRPDDKQDEDNTPENTPATTQPTTPSNGIDQTKDNRTADEVGGFFGGLAATLGARPTDAVGNPRSTSPVADRLNNTVSYSGADVADFLGLGVTADVGLIPEQSQALANGAAVMDGVFMTSPKAQISLYQADLRLQQRGLEYQRAQLAETVHPRSSDTLKAADIDQQLQDIAARRDALDQISQPNLDTGLTPEILHFDPKEDGGIVVAYGDIKNASHIAVMVPGMTTDLNSFPLTNTRARNLMVELSDEQGVTPAVVGYLGYDAPDGLFEAFFDDQAVEGAPAFADFLNTLPEDADVDVLAYSYGSLLAGKAVALGARPDSVHIFGSPGIGVDSIDELHLDGKTVVTSTVNPGDLVSFSERFGEVPPEGAISYPPIGQGHRDYFDPTVLTDITMGRRAPVLDEQ